VVITPGPVAATESWNGTTWSQVDELNTARNDAAGSGTQYCSFSFWWTNTSNAATGATEEFDNPSLSNKVVTAS
jgi:hypothetical protein